ncbi:MAG: prolyl oligopeptidase family serine peptidase [Steroidobacteraceae bacterium]
MLFVRVVTLGVLAFSITAAAQTSAGSAPVSVEPALRELWTRGSERFQRQWLVTAPIDAATAAAIDPAALKPAASQPLAAKAPDVRWVANTSWSDVSDLDRTPPRVPEVSDAPVNRFVYAAASLPSALGGPAELSIGSGRPYSAWLNGRLIHTRDAAEAFSPDKDRVAVEMRPGDNLVLLRLHETSAGPSQFSLRVVPPGAELKKVDEIAPSIVPATGESLAVRTHFAVEKASSPVVLEVIAAGGEVVARESAARGEVVKFDSSGWRDGAYEIRVSTQNAWKQPQVRYLPWYKGDSIAAVRRLIAVADDAKADVHGDNVRMLAALAKDRLGGLIDKASRSAWRLVHSPLMEFEELQLEDRGRAARIRPSGFVRIAYRDEVDGSTQYCRAYLPAEYSAAKAWPLIVFLHGFNPANPEYIDWWSVEQRHQPLAETKGTIVIDAHGRGNAQYLGMGDLDVMRCLDEAKWRFSVDADRVYLTGESMGGHGTWAIATRHPDVFAAAAPVFGGWDFRVSNVGGSSVAGPSPSRLEAFGLERASSFANAENLLHVPLLIVHGDADRAVNVENSRHAVRLLQRWGYDVSYHEMPGWDHEDLGQQATIADWLLTHKRVVAPRTIRLRATDTIGAAAYWLRVRSFEQPAEVIRVSAEVLQPGLVRIDSTNVAAFTLDLPAELRGTTDKLRVVWNGKAQELSAPAGGVFELGARVDTTGLQKHAGLAGPLPTVIATPFAVVVGTTSSDSRMREFIKARADSLAQRWLDWQHQPLRMFKDTEITATQEKAYSLILIGGAEANAVTQRIAKKLPFNASRNGIVVDGREWPVKDSVLQAIYPSPLNADRYMYVVAATSSEGMYFWKPQLVHFTRGGYPLSIFDWVIQDGRRPPAGTLDPAKAFVAAGVFDASWRRQDRATQVRDQAAASTWTLRRAPIKNFVPSATTLQSLAGRYEIEPGFEVTFRVEGAGLIADIPYVGAMPLVAESESVFVAPANGDAMEFIRDAANNVTGASLEDYGSLLWAKRLP